MNRIYFAKTLTPCVCNEVTLWHLSHGWLWNVYDRKQQCYIGVFFATLMCGEGVIVHFDRIPGAVVDAPALLCAFRRGMRLVCQENIQVVYATIPSSKKKLIRCACKLGFTVCSDANYFRCGKEISLLKYLPHPIC